MEQLLRYALKNDTIACMSILKKWYIPNKLSPDLFTDEIGRTALWIAMMNAWTFYDLPQCLIDHGASVNSNIKNIYGRTLVYDIIETQNINGLKFLLKNNIKMINKVIDISTAITPLMLACKVGNLDTVKLILNHMISIEKTRLLLNERDLNDNTALMYSSSIKITKLLLFHHSFQDIVNVRNINNETALFLAASRGLDEIVELLMQLDADPYIERQQDRFNALHIAILNGHRNVVLKLTMYCPKLLLTDVKKNNKNISPLEFAKLENKYHLIRLISSQTYEYERNAGIIPYDTPPPHCRRKKSKNELQILKRFLNALSVYSKRQQMVSILRENNLERQRKRYLINGKKLQIHIFDQWYKMYKSRKRSFHIFEDLKTSHERPLFHTAFPNASSFSGISLYKKQLNIFEVSKFLYSPKT